MRHSPIIRNIGYMSCHNDSSTGGAFGLFYLWSESGLDQVQWPAPASTVCQLTEIMLSILNLRIIKLVSVISAWFRRLTGEAKVSTKTHVHLHFGVAKHSGCLFLVEDSHCQDTAEPCPANINRISETRQLSLSAQFGITS
jgi:hypothetical protein